MKHLPVCNPIWWWLSVDIGLLRERAGCTGCRRPMRNGLRAPGQFGATETHQHLDPYCPKYLERIPFTYASFPSRIQNDIVGPYIFHRFETNALFLAVWQRQPLKHKQNLGVKSSPYSVHIFITAQQRMWLYSLFFTQKSLFASLPSHLASKSCFSKEERKNKDYTNGFQSPATWPLNNMCGTH